MYFKQTMMAATVITLSLGAASGFCAVSEVVIHPSNVHVPRGFDSNDHTEVIVIGDLPDTCYRRPVGYAKVVDKEIIIDMEATKISDANMVCIQALVPYMVSVPLGRLAEGSYTIAVNRGNGPEWDSELFVDKPSSNSIDNFTYANVTNVKKLPGTDTLLIEGVHPSSCMAIDRVEEIPNATGDTVAVLPIIKQVNTQCDRLMTPFTYELPLRIRDQKGVVFHVRKLDGTALNYLLDINS